MTEPNRLGDWEEEGSLVILQSPEPVDNQEEEVTVNDLNSFLEDTL